jgi:hypothetical protein
MAKKVIGKLCKMGNQIPRALQLIFFVANTITCKTMKAKAIPPLGGSETKSGKRQKR